MEARFFGSGRGALIALASHLGAHKVCLPSYFCREVAAAIEGSGFEVGFYSDRPGGPGPGVGLRNLDLLPGDLVVLVDLFGLRSADELAWNPPPGVHTVSDHTHGSSSPCAFETTAHYAFASLRKLWPLPDGAVLWSPSGRALPAVPPLFAGLEAASREKEEGMRKKADFLRGEPLEKELFRKHLARGEAALFSGLPSAMCPASLALSRRFPLPEAGARRQANHAAFCEALGVVAGVQVLRPGDGASTPFGVLLVFDDPGRRNAVHAGLIEARIYASRLWPLVPGPGVQPEDLRLSVCSFTLPTDLRYSIADLSRAGRILRALL